MLRLEGERQEDLFGGWIPEEFLKFSEELEFADKALSGPRILEVFEKNAKTIGRPSVPTRLPHYFQRTYLFINKLVFY